MSWFEYLTSKMFCKALTQYYDNEDPREQVKYLFHDERPSCYIMTLGVIDECRKLGLGTLLIEETFQIVRTKYPMVQFLYLHVVDYNEAAIRFYKEKNGFK